MNNPTVCMRRIVFGFFGVATLSLAAPVFALPNAETSQNVSAPEETNALLSLHNKERARLSLPPLVWDTKLAHTARRYAKKLADEDKFEHAPQSPGDDAQGENLWMGTRGFYKWNDMVGSWIEERAFTRSGIFPNVSVTGNWTDVGHYTQVISAKTKYVGCGLERNAQDEFLVCRYFPAGNEYGEVVRVK
jgi:uncharacterized protein YkwD